MILFTNIVFIEVSKSYQYLCFHKKEEILYIFFNRYITFNV